jgi:hypothetical protein
MAVTPTRVTVSSAAILIAENTSSSGGGEGDYRNWRFLVKNITGTDAIYLGGPGVTTGTGFRWDVADGPLSDFELEPGEQLFGISAGADQTVHVLREGR